VQVAHIHAIKVRELQGGAGQGSGTAGRAAAVGLDAAG
jgi:hypothetical protein